MVAETSSATADWFGARLAEVGARQTAALVKMQAQMFDVLQGWIANALRAPSPKPNSRPPPRTS
jgi:hypothetical protein